MPLSWGPMLQFQVDRAGTPSEANPTLKLGPSPYPQSPLPGLCGPYSSGQGPTLPEYHSLYLCFFPSDMKNRDSEPRGRGQCARPPDRAGDVSAGLVASVAGSTPPLDEETAKGGWVVLAG